MGQSLIIMTRTGASDNEKRYRSSFLGFVESHGGRCFFFARGHQ
jgi:hypothetical protein